MKPVGVDGGASRSANSCKLPPHLLRREEPTRVGARVRDAELGPQLEAIGKKNYSVDGKRKLTKAARRRGLDCGRDQVARLMRRRGIRGASRAKRRFTTHADASHLRAPDLV